MNRREFFKSSVAVAGAGTLASLTTTQAAEQNDSTDREYYELRLYHLRRGPKQKLMDDFFREVGIPALNRSGVGPVGVFNVMFGPDSPTLYVLVKHKTLASLTAVEEHLHSDAELKKAADEVINAPTTDPAYIRIESSLMVAFAGMPKLEVPAGVADGKPRIFELRTYESHSKKANLTKIGMFNSSEIAIFRRHRLQPVFFGETLVGTKLPNLTYMLTFENMAAREKNWGAFASDPEWKKLSSTPGLTDPEIVSNISNIFLKPTSYSQI